MGNHSKRHRIKETLLAVVVLCALVFVPGCAGGLPTVTVTPEPMHPMMTVTHEPMHPTNVQMVTFKAEAWDALEDGVDKVVLAYERYALDEGPNGEHLQTLVEPLTTVATCDPAGTVSSLTCEYTMDSAFPANSFIRLHATAYGGSESSSKSYSFAAGDYPWPNDPIPIRVDGPPAARLDVVFIPDADTTVATLQDNLDEVIGLYFKYPAIDAFRGLYNFYYSGVHGDYEELCTFTDPSNMGSLAAVGDAIAILHSANLRDCRLGNKMSSEIDYDKTLLHETGHALFDLRDEYCCDSSYSQQACVPNLWGSLSACEAEASSIGYPTSNCTQLSDGTQTLDFWYIDPAGVDGCMMGDSLHNADSDFGQACTRRIYWRYGKCLGGGKCFPYPACP